MKTVSSEFADELESLLGAPLFPPEPLTSSKYVVYGAGNCGRNVARVLAESGREVRAFIDVKATGEMNGFPIYSPKSVEAGELAKDDACAVLGVFNCAADPWPILSLSTNLGFKRVVSFQEFHELFGLAPHYWVAARSLTVRHADQLKELLRILRDDVSRRLLLDLVRLRLTFDLSLLREPDWGGQYFPKDLPRPTGAFRMIDGGAFTGDTLGAMLEKGMSFSAVAAFEPDPANYRQLSGYVGEQPGKFGDVMLWPCGLGAATGTASFQPGHGTGSAITAVGNTHVQIVKLDDALPAFEPNFIKLDIEGFELSALKGACKMIGKHQPSLAICIYHTPEHLWEIPLYLHQLLPNHKIALRYHTYNAFDVVAYAIP